MFAWIVGGLVIAAVLAVGFVFTDRYQRCPTCKKFTLSYGGTYKVSCVNKATGQYYPEARMLYECRQCGKRHERTFAGKWTSTNGVSTSEKS